MAVQPPPVRMRREQILAGLVRMHLRGAGRRAGRLTASRAQAADKEADTDQGDHHAR